MMCFFRTKWYVIHYSIWIPIGEGIVTIIVIANFTLATFMDPGIIPKGIKIRYDNIGSKMLLSNYTERIICLQLREVKMTMTISGRRCIKQLRFTV